MLITITLAAELALLATILGALVGRSRLKYSVFLGDGGQAALLRAQRAHGNLTEWAPLALAVIGGMEFMGASHLMTFALAEAYIIGRIMHAIGILREREKPNIFRALGAGINAIVMVWASFYILSMMDWQTLLP